MPEKLLFADERGQVFEHPELLALALDDSAPGRASLPLGRAMRLPAFAQLAVLPGRRPVGLDPQSGKPVELTEMKMGRRTLRPLAVGAVLPPGFTRTAIPAYKKSAIAPVLPQWAYTAAAWDDALGGHVTWALHTDKRGHWDPADHSTPELAALVKARLAREPGNDLLKQLARCALEWRCFTAQNTFYVRDE